MNQNQTIQALEAKRLKLKLKYAKKATKTGRIKNPTKAVQHIGKLMRLAGKIKAIEWEILKVRAQPIPKFASGCSNTPPLKIQPGCGPYIQNQGRGQAIVSGSSEGSFIVRGRGWGKVQETGAERIIRNFEFSNLCQNISNIAEMKKRPAFPFFSPEEQTKFNDSVALQLRESLEAIRNRRFRHRPHFDRNESLARHYMQGNRTALDYYRDRIVKPSVKAALLPNVYQY
jgi:hypothetical protein